MAHPTSRVLALCTLSSVVLATQPALADDAPPVEEVIAAAREQGQALVIEFYTTWCGPCKDFKANVLPLASVKSALGAVHFVQYDAEAGNGLPAASQYNVTGYPTFLVLDGTGKEVLRELGSMTEERFLAFLTRADIEVLDEDAMGRRISKSPYDPKVLISAARWYRARGKVSEALDMYRRAGAADRGNRAGVAADARWESTELRRYRSVRGQLVRDWTHFIRSYPGSPNALHAFEVVAASGTIAPERLERIAALIVDGLGDSGPALNSAAYAFLAAGAHNAAITAARRQVALDPTQANPYDTLAEALHYAGRQAEAIEASKKGVALAAPAMKPVFEANLARFEAPGRTPVYDVDVNRYQAATYLGGLPGDDPSAQKALEPPRRASTVADDAAASAERGFKKAAAAAYIAAGARCVDHAGGLPEVYVRLELGAKRKVVVLEPGAPRKLVRCLARELAAASLPEAPPTLGGRLTMPLPLRP